MKELTEKASLIALLRTHNKQWQKVTELVSHFKSAEYVLKNRVVTELPEDVEQLPLNLAPNFSYPPLEPIIKEILTWEEEGFQFQTILDKGYPKNLLGIFNRPPFVFIQGNLKDEDLYSVAIVGTRSPSGEGLKRASRLSKELSREGVAVISGLAKGIDAAALRASLDTRGRAFAVIGTGLNIFYPKENRELQREIGRRGAVISQFWPDDPPIQFHFPLRNIVMSGIALATVVVEASETSGAKMQARFALEHGRHLFLLESLLEKYKWAREYSMRPGATIVYKTEDVLSKLSEIISPREVLPVG